MDLLKNQHQVVDVLYDFKCRGEVRPFSIQREIARSKRYTFRLIRDFPTINLPTGQGSSLGLTYLGDFILVVSRLVWVSVTRYY